MFVGDCHEPRMIVNIPKILNVNSFLVDLNLISCSVVNGQEQPVVYNFLLM